MTAATNILHGKVDILRTPLYSLFLKLCESIWGAGNMIKAACYIQIIVYYISMYFFYRCLKYFVLNRVVLCAGTVVYGCASIIIGFNTIALTEPFAVSGVVFFAFCLLRYLNQEQEKERSMPWMICASFLAFLLTMLRPAGVYLFLAIAILLATQWMFDKKRRQETLWAGLSCLVCVSLVFGYMLLNKLSNNFFGLSYVSTMNQFYDVVQAGIYMDNSDTEVARDVQARIDSGTGQLRAAFETDEAFASFSPRNRIGDFNKEAIRNHFGEYCGYIWQKALDMGNNRMLYNYSHDGFKEGEPKVIMVGDYYAFNINFVYLLLVMEIGTVGYLIINKKKYPKESILIILLIAGQIGLNLLAGPAEYHRLNAPVYPFAIILTAKCTDAIMQWQVPMSTVATETDRN